MAAGLVIGGWFASTVITKLITGLVDYAKDQTKKQLGLKDELERLGKALPKIQAVVDAVDQGLLKEENPALEKWLWQLRDAADQADDVMDEMEYNSVKEKVEAGKDKVHKVVSNLKTFLKRAVHKDAFLEKLKAAVKAIDDVASDVEHFYILVQGLANKQKEKDESTINSRETSSVLDVETHVFGRQNEAEAIIKKLLNPECKTKEVNFAVLPIIGGGGVGKTTLAQCVYNAPEVKKHFELRMWICVSNNFDVGLLTKNMYEAVFKRTADFINFDLIKTELKEELMSKRFLVVFDDAWNDDDGLGWKKLFAPLKSGMSGSMILLTTRMETVARLTGPNLMDYVFLKGLNEPDMWDLFEECAFGGKDPNDYTELVQIGKGIVKKLNGNPLAARTVGGALCSDLTEIHWRGILESELWSLEQGPNDIMPALRLSYQHLSSHLKPCFSFCSIFPQDHVFIKDDLIYMWLALGLVPRDFNGGRKPEDVGSKYFEDMLKRSVFTPTNPFDISPNVYLAQASKFGKKFAGGYIMHDLMHDLSTFVSQGECFRYDTSKSVHIPTTVRHLYIHVGACYELSNFNLKNIRTLIVQLADSNHTEPVSILNRMLKGIRSLRILTLVAPMLSEIPESVGDLLHLRYFSSDSCILHGFPKSMSKIFLLETIVIGGFNFDQEANVLVKLNNLRHIIASEPFLAKIGRLTSLQELCFRVGKDSGFKISELGEMKELRRLSISNINDVNTHEEAKQANLKNKVDLRELTLQWETKIRELSGSKSRERKIFDEMVLDHLEPYRNLKELIIRGYMGGRMPVWESESLSSLVKLEISDCHNLISLDEGLLRNCENLVALKELRIMNCNELKMPKEGFKRFISLQRLDVSGCPKIKIFDVLVFCHPSNLRFLRINGYMDNSVEKNSYVNDFIGNLNENIISESSLEQDPTLHVEEAKILVLDHPVESSNWEMRLLRMRDYIGRWPPIWLTKTLSTLEYLCIDGSPHTNQHHSNDGIDLLLELIRLDEIGKGYFPSLEIAYPSNMPATEQIYLAMQHIKHVQYSKKLTLALCSKSFVMPPLPATLKELRLNWLDLKVLTNNCGDSEANLSKALESVYSLSSLTLVECKNISSLPPKEVFSRWRTLEKLQFVNCTELTSLESLFGLSSVRILTICGSRRLVSAITSPPAGNKDKIVGSAEDDTIQTSNRPASIQPTPTDTSSSTNTKHKPLLSVDELKIDDPLLLSIEPIRSLSSIRKLTINDFSGMRSSLLEVPSFFVTLKELRLCNLGMVDLPNLCINHSEDLGSLLPLVSMEIVQCSNLVSLAEGLFQKPQQFAALEKLKILNCKRLRELPQGGFNKFVSLKELKIVGCPEIEGQLVPECFLPSALQVLHISDCGNLDATLTKALESVQSLISLELCLYNNITNLPPKEVFSRWKTLVKLEFACCYELTSLESLLGLSSVGLLTIWGCPKLVSAITSPSAVKRVEIEGLVEEGTIHTSNKPTSTQPKSTYKSSSTNTEHKPLLSVDELKIDDPLLLSMEPIRSLSSVRKLAIADCSGIQSLPELPPILEELSLKWCSPELQRRCEESEEDWPKLSHIPKVSISGFYY